MPPKKRHKNPPRRPVAQAEKPAEKPAEKVAAARQAVKRAGLKRRMSSNTKFTAALLAVVLAVVGMIWWANRDTAPAAGVAVERLVRPNSHKLSTAADGKVTVVEFLDFECPSCGAAYPGVERLRAEYGDRITYVVRLFPLPGHKNGMPAAKAAQAAANQGKFEAMYQKMFETQDSWGGQQADQSATFQQFAKDIGLDMQRYATDVAAAATTDFINAEIADAEAVKVTGTPTFFVNAQKFTGQPTYDGLKAAVEAAFAA